MSTPVQTEHPGGYEGWTILELLGHRKLAGYVREVVVAGAGFLRIDVPRAEGEGWVATQLYPPSSVYAITPVAESIARAVAARNQPEPVARWELPAPPKDVELYEEPDDEPDDVELYEEPDDEPDDEP